MLKLQNVLFPVCAVSLALACGQPQTDKEGNDSELTWLRANRPAPDQSLGMYLWSNRADEGGVAASCWYWRTQSVSDTADWRRWQQRYGRTNSLHQFLIEHSQAVITFPVPNSRVTEQIELAWNNKTREARNQLGSTAASCGLGAGVTLIQILTGGVSLANPAVAAGFAGAIWACKNQGGTQGRIAGELDDIRNAWIAAQPQYAAAGATGTGISTGAYQVLKQAILNSHPYQLTKECKKANEIW